MPVLPSAGSPGLVAACAVLALYGCGGGESESSAQAEAPGRPAAVPVAVKVVASGPAESVLRAWGAVEARREAELVAGVPGRVEAAHVALGDVVRRGDPLVEVDAAFYRAALEEAEALLASAHAALEKAERDLSRNEELFKTSILSDTEIETFRNIHLVARAAHAQAAANLERARRNWADARLTAPFDGQVALRPPDPGSSVSVGMPLTRVVDLGRVRVRAEVSEQDLGRITGGMPAALTVEGIPGRSFTGTVTALGPQADAASRQFPVDIEVENPAPHPLKAGMVARVEIVVERYESLPLLPVEALVEDGTRVGYFAVVGGVARWRAATIGPRMERTVALLSGGAASDSAVVLGQNRLVDGAPVRTEVAP